MTFKRGDRVRLNKTKLRELEKERPSSWDDFEYGTITQPKSKGYSGYGSDLPDGTAVCWGVRWDEYTQYGDSPTNCHTADEVLLLPDAPDEDELAEAMASIEQAARKTMSTRRLP